LNALTPGLLPPVTRDRAGYELFFATKLNRAELINQQAALLYLGSSYAQSLDDLPGELFLAICEDEATAFEAMCNANNGRERARLHREQVGGVRTRKLMG